MLLLLLILLTFLLDFPCQRDEQSFSYLFCFSKDCCVQHVYKVKLPSLLTGPFLNTVAAQWLHSGGKQWLNAFAFHLGALWRQALRRTLGKRVYHLCRLIFKHIPGAHVSLFCLWFCWRSWVGPAWAKAPQIKKEGWDRFFFIKKTSLQLCSSDVQLGLARGANWTLLRFGSTLMPPITSATLRLFLELFCWKQNLKKWGGVNP